jgi:small subunit ribosomal protein S2
MTDMTVTMRDMLEAGVHFGHQKRYWNPEMAPYIYGSRQKIHIINLEKTLPMFREAANFVRHIADSKGKVLFVGTKPVASEVIQTEAIRCGMPYVSHRWLGGMLTNYKTIRSTIKRLKEIESILASDAVHSFTKKESLMMLREKARLINNIGGIKDMAGLPDALFVVDVHVERIAIREANCLGIPVIGVVDTNNSPQDLNYVIPGNDDSMRAIGLYVRHMADIILEAKSKARAVDDVQRAKQAKANSNVQPEKRRIVTKKAVIRGLQEAKEPVKKPAKPSADAAGVQADDGADK